MTNPFDNRYFRALVVLYALHQIGHVAANLQYFFWPVLKFPPPPASGAWHGQILDFFNGIGVIDTGSALMGLLFVYGYWKRRPWSLWIGLVATAAYASSMLIFAWGLFASETWANNLPAQIVVHVSFLPTLFLLVWLCLVFHHTSEAMFRSSPERVPSPDGTLRPPPRMNRMAK